MGSCILTLTLTCDQPILKLTTEVFTLSSSQVVCTCTILISGDASIDMLVEFSGSLEAGALDRRSLRGRTE